MSPLTIIVAKWLKATNLSTGIKDAKMLEIPLSNSTIFHFDLGIP
jgi:hypothetical protein